MTIKEQAEKHLRARWAWLGRRNWQGSLSFKVYRSANLRTVMGNIRDGLVPDGRGKYRR
jgi:hypothetical protein